MSNMEKEIAGEILRGNGRSVSEFGLRFDRVATRVLGAHPGRSIMIQGNSLRIRRIDPALERAPKLIGFVHNSDSDPNPLLDLAERWLGAPAQQPSSALVAQPETGA